MTTKASRVEIFTRDEFEAQALPVNKTTGEALWTYIGVQGGEHAYVVKMPKHNVGIEVRSSVRTDGKSAKTGEDSIRCWLVDTISGQPMGSKVSRWTTRLPGWGERTKEVIRQLWQMGTKITPCPTCVTAPKGTDTRLRCFKVKKEGPNKGRLFLRCPCDGCTFFEWINMDEDGEVVTPVKREPIKEPAQDKVPYTTSAHGEIQGDPCPDCGGVVKIWESRKDGKNKGKWFYSCNGKTSNNGEKGCGFFQWAEEVGESNQEPSEDSEPEVKTRKTETFAVEVPAGMQDKLEALLKTIGGRVCF